MLTRLGFVGFGEAAFHIAKGLRAEGVAEIFAFDIKVTPKVRARAEETETVLCGSTAGLAQRVDVILSAVTADQAIAAATEIAPYLSARHLYGDLNSVSPKAKEAVASHIDAASASFVEIAVMGPVPPHGHKVPLLIGGAGAPQFQSLFEPLGMRMEIVATDVVGRAAAVKMFRSVVYKGIEALLFECVLGAGQYGADDRVFASLNASIPGVDWKKLADYMIGRVVVHGERRAREMDEVAKTLEELGIEPHMARATSARFDWAAGLGLREQFDGEFPQTYDEVLEVLDLKTVKAAETA